jgi:hypothetical protein
MPESRKPLKRGLGTGETKLLTEIRENYDTDYDSFADIREAGSQDIKYITNDPWPEKEKQKRKESNRPMVSCDLLNQFCNQVINEVRRNPREIKIRAAGYGATAQLAEYHENRVRAIQYKSDAQAAYICGMENQVQRSYGFWRVTVRYVSETSFDQEIRIVRIPNPDAVLFPECKEIDCSDAEHCFVLDNYTTSKFRERWPKAEVTDFSGDFARDYPHWVKDKSIQVAEYWKVFKQRDTLVEYDTGGAEGIQVALLSELGGKLEDSVLKLPAADGALRIRRRLHGSRETHVRKVRQFITNGIEILEENDWLGKWIPIVPVWGKEFYVQENGTSKRMLASLVRNARDAQMSYNYFKTCQTEAAGMVPKTTRIGYEGQFEGHEDEWEKANREPVPYLEVKAKLDGDDEVLPLPQAQNFDPPIQSLEMGAQSFEQAVQRAVGMYNTAVGEHDTNVRSGKAIQELDAQSDEGAFHFIDNFNRAITLTGKIVMDLKKKIEITEREVPIRKADGTESTVRINTEQPYQDEQGLQHHYPGDVGEFEETVTVGPTFDSQRDEATDFLESFMKEVLPILADPAQRNQLIALSIKLRQLGPIGDQMAEILVPPPGQNPQQTALQLQNLQAQLQQLQQENAALHADRAGRVLEQSTKITIAKIKEMGDNMRAQLSADLKAYIANVQTKAQDTSERRTLFVETQRENAHAATGAAHEFAMQQDQHEHEHAIADKNAASAAELQANDAAAQAAPDESPSGTPQV